MSTNESVNIVVTGNHLFYAIDYDGDVVFSQSEPPYLLQRYDRVSNVVSSTQRTGVAHPITVSNDGAKVSYWGSKSVVIYDLATGNSTAINKGHDGSPANGGILSSQMSKSGDYVAFMSTSTNLVAGPPAPSAYNVYVYDVNAATVTRVDMNHPDYGPLYPSKNYNYGKKIGISDDGRFVTFCTEDASRAVTSGAVVYDRTNDLVEALISAPNGSPGSMVYPDITPDGRYVSALGAAYVNGRYTGLYAVAYDRDGSLGVAVSAGADQTVEQTSALGADALLHGELTTGSCSSGAFNWSWDSGAASGSDPIIQLPGGTTTVTLDWSGCNMTAEDSVDVTVQDTLAPSLSANVIGTQGNNGWYTSDVTVELDATDNGSGVQNIQYSQNGASVVDPGGSATISLALEAQNVLTAQAVDVAANASQAQTFNIAIDKTAPVSSVAPSGKVNSDGLYVTDVAVTLQSADATSGLQSVNYSVNGGVWQTATSGNVVTLIDDGAYSLQYYAIDQAGNNEPVNQFAFSINQSLLGPALIDDVQDIVPQIPAASFVGNNPNYAGKLTSELDKVLGPLAEIDDTLTPAAKLREYKWSRMMLDDKVRNEFVRMIEDPQTLSSILLIIDEAVAALDKQIAEISALL